MNALSRKMNGKPNAKLYLDCLQKLIREFMRRTPPPICIIPLVIQESAFRRFKPAEKPILGLRTV
jgi:hypothetical protein